MFEGEGGGRDIGPRPTRRSSEHRGEGRVPFAADLLAAVAGDEERDLALRREAIMGLALHSTVKLDVLEGLLGSGPGALRAEAARSLRGVKVSEEIGRAHV